MGLPPPSPKKKKKKKKKKMDKNPHMTKQIYDITLTWCVILCQINLYYQLLLLLHNNKAVALSWWLLIQNLSLNHQSLIKIFQIKLRIIFIFSVSVNMLQISWFHNQTNKVKNIFLQSVLFLFSPEVLMCRLPDILKNLGK